jgi:carboxyl-terminal processing protease
MRETFEARPDADPRDVAREAAHAVIKSLYGHPLAAAYKLRPATPAGLSISASVVEEGYFVVLSEVEALRYGDLIMRIDDAELDGLSAFDAMELAAGEPGTPIKVTVKRPGVDQPVVVHTSRMAIKPTPGGVQTFGEVGYLRLHHSNEVAKDLGSKLAIFETSGITSIILDLRDSTLDVFWPERAAAEHFFPGQEVAKLRYRDAREELLVANKSGAVWSKPVVVLVNARTQGYAEVLAAALRQHRGAELVGCQTYGPGSFIYDRAGTDHGLSFPTAEIIGAHGENLSSGSLKPDVAVAACDPVPEPDAALAEAIRVAKRPAWLRTACRYARIGRLDGLLGC